MLWVTQAANDRNRSKWSRLVSENQIRIQFERRFKAVNILKEKLSYQKEFYMNRSSRCDCQLFTGNCFFF